MAQRSPPCARWPRLARGMHTRVLPMWCTVLSDSAGVVTATPGAGVECLCGGEWRVLRHRDGVWRGWLRLLSSGPLRSRSSATWHAPNLAVVPYVHTCGDTGFPARTVCNPLGRSR